MKRSDIYALKFKAGEGTFKIDAEALTQLDRDTLRVFPGDIVKGYFECASALDGSCVKCQITTLILSTDYIELELENDGELTQILEQEMEKDDEFISEAMENYYSRDPMDWD